MGEQGLTSHARKKDVLRLFQKILQLECVGDQEKGSEEAPKKKKKSVQEGIYREGVASVAWRASDGTGTTTRGVIYITFTKVILVPTDGVDIPHT